MTPSAPLQIVWIEDSAEDAELFSSMLDEQGLRHAYSRVEDEPSLVAALNATRVDVVISDLELPGYSGHHALATVRRQRPDVPFVFLSGAMGEETAVLALQQGATDYVLKHSPQRLCSALVRAVREAELAAERERVHAELVRAQRNESLALLIAGLSHDLRNVLQPLGLCPHLLRARPDAETANRVAAVIEESARRGHDLAQAMIDFARGQNHANDSCKLAAVLDGIRLLLAGSVPRHTTLQIIDRSEGAQIAGHATELQQCLLNLCLNGLHAMESRASGVLEIEAWPGADGAIMIEVRDTGCGMPPEVQAQLFTPFFTTKRDGTGLGMLSCRRIIESLGGALEVSSTVGVGTTMRLRCRRIPDPAPVGAAGTDAAPTAA